MCNCNRKFTAVWFGIACVSSAILGVIISNRGMTNRYRHPERNESITEFRIDSPNPLGAFPHRTQNKIVVKRIMVDGELVQDNGLIDGPAWQITIGNITYVGSGSAE